MECPGGMETCGRKLAVEVFYTGVTVKREMQKAETKEQARVVFILTVSGKGFCQRRRPFIYEICRQSCGASNKTPVPNLPAAPLLLYACG